MLDISPALPYNIHMKEYRFFFGALAVMGLVMCFVYSSRMMPVLVVSIALAILLSLLPAVAGFFLIQLAVSPKEIRCEKNERFVAKIVVTNRSVFGFAPLRLRLRCQSGNHLLDAEGQIMVPPFSTVPVTLEFQLPYRGKYDIGVSALEFCDMFNLFRFKKRVRGMSQAVIHPREFAMMDNNRDEQDLQAAHTSTSHFAGDTDFSSLREYREGEPLRRVHWKVSSKRDDLIIRQTEQSADSKRVVLCDFSFVSADEDLQMQATDTVIETALAITRHAVETGVAAVVITSGDKSGRDIGDMNDYRALMRHFTALPAKNAGAETAADLLRRTKDICPVSDGELFIITAARDSALTPRLTEAGASPHGGVLIYCGQDHEAADEWKSQTDYLQHHTNIRYVEAYHEDIPAALRQLANENY